MSECDCDLKKYKSSHYPLKALAIPEDSSAKFELRGFSIELMKD